MEKYGAWGKAAKWLVLGIGLYALTSCPSDLGDRYSSSSSEPYKHKIERHVTQDLLTARPYDGD